MKRRELITLLGGAAAWSLAASAQDAGPLRRVGVLSSISESDPEAQTMVTALHQALQASGWADGRHLRIDHRWAGSPGRIDAFAKQLVALQPDAIVAHTTPSVAALRKVTVPIPIVFVQVSDPIGSGFIVNLAHPGGNITGFTNFEPTMVGKWVEMIKEIALAAARIAILFNPDTAPSPP
jgi:putative ABC transport system substrate-binding protein